MRVRMISGRNRT